MATHNGYVDGTILNHTGDITWADKTSWSSYTSWIEYTSTTIETATGAKGTPLRWQSDILDLGVARNVYPVIDVGSNGQARVVIEYHASSSDLSSKKTIGLYTDDNSTTGTIETYSVLDYLQADYTDFDTSPGTGFTTTSYLGFNARYVRITVFVEAFEIGGTRQQTFISNINIKFLSDTIERSFVDATASTFAESTVPYLFYETDNYGTAPVQSVQITPHYDATNEQDLVPLIVSKGGGKVGFRIMNAAGNAATGWTIDMSVKYLPEVRAYGLDGHSGIRRLR